MSSTPRNVDEQARAKVLSAGHTVVRYLCLCGKECTTTRDGWPEVARTCRCGAAPRSYPRISLIGHRYGRLKVVAWLGKKNKGWHHYWRAECDCGGATEVAGGDLRRQDRPTLSCGCLTIEWARSEARKSLLRYNLTGERFGRLVALEQLPARGRCRNYWWRCQCDCGNTTETNVSRLTLGKATSCGCWMAEPKQRDLTGHQFGHLTVKRRTVAAEQMMMERWQCRCSCGSLLTLYRYQLFSQDPDQNCGCIPLKARLATNSGLPGPIT